MVSVKIKKNIHLRCIIARYKCECITYHATYTFTTEFSFDLYSAFYFYVVLVICLDLQHHFLKISVWRVFGVLAHGGKQDLNLSKVSK